VGGDFCNCIVDKADLGTPFRKAELSRYDAVFWAWEACVRRREFMAALGGAGAWPFFARAQPGRVAKVGILAYGNQANSPVIEAFRSELRDLGYIEGRNLAVEFRSAADDPSRIGDLAFELVLASVDVTVTDGLASAVAAKKATTSIPIVMAVILDPVAAGVTSYARPGGNVTGFTVLAPELGTKRLEILKEAVPGLKRVGVVTNGAAPMNAAPQRPSLQDVFVWHCDVARADHALRSLAGSDCTTI
jgi:putative tryptophan/tyrosine transport system substrate-binding protein